MGDKSKIEWTDATWTPIRARNRTTGNVGWHCEHATTGCEFCYSENMNKRLGTGLPFKPGHRKDVELFLDKKMLTAPLRWLKPRMIFVCSMTDVFADFVPDEMILQILNIIRRTSTDGGQNCGSMVGEHTYQVLTKRPARMAAFMQRLRFSSERGLYLSDDDNNRPVVMKNLWLGTSAERQQEADERIPHLLATPAAVRFVSLEPLLGPIDLTRICLLEKKPGSHRAGIHVDVLRGLYCESGCDYIGNWDINRPCPTDWPPIKLDWVIVGGESGRGARPMHPDWARSLRDQCAAAQTPFFFKQWGEWWPWAQGSAAQLDDGPEQTKHATQEWRGDHWTDVGYLMWCNSVDGNTDDTQCVGRVGKRAAGRLLDGDEHNGMPGLNMS